MTYILPPALHRNAKILFIASSPDAREVRQGSGRQHKLQDAIADTGKQYNDASYSYVCGIRPKADKFYLHSAADVARGCDELAALLAAEQPNLVVALGAEAAWATVADWPSKHKRGIMAATAAMERRGYLWEGRHGGKVLTTLSPQAVADDRSGISEMLFIADVEHAFAEAETQRLKRPRRDVVIVETPVAAAMAAKIIRDAGRCACDIENLPEPPHSAACIGFAVSADLAYVFTPATFSTAFSLLEDPSLQLVWQNAQYDLYVLLTRHGVRTQAADDTIIMWHSLWPEMAGKAQEGKKGAKRTHKGLAFLASLYTADAWWKDYNFTEQRDKYILNGRDCCITLEIADKLLQELEVKQCTEIYRSTMQRIWPVVEMQKRGLLIDEAERQKAIAELTIRKDAAATELIALAEPILSEAREKLSNAALIWKRHVCPCCRNGKDKRQACYSCLGYDKKPAKPELLRLAQKHIRGNGGTLQSKAKDLEAMTKLKAAALVPLALLPCKQCSGLGEWETYEFNPGSDEQLSMLLFEALKLPQRSGVDEASLKSLLGTLS